MDGAESEPADWGSWCRARVSSSFRLWSSRLACRKARSPGWILFSSSCCSLPGRAATAAGSARGSTGDSGRIDSSGIGGGAESFSSKLCLGWELDEEPLEPSPSIFMALDCVLRDLSIREPRLDLGFSRLMPRELLDGIGLPSDWGVGDPDRLLSDSTYEVSFSRTRRRASASWFANSSMSSSARSSLGLPAALSSAKESSIPLGALGLSRLDSPSSRSSYVHGLDLEASVFAMVGSNDSVW